MSEEKYKYYEENVAERSGYIFESNISRFVRGRNNSHSSLLEASSLFEFYKPYTQRIGRSTIITKSSTVFRQGEKYSMGNTQSETLLYRYFGAPQYKRYTDIYPYRDSYSYVGDQKDNSDIINEMKSRNMLLPLVSSKKYLYPNEEEDSLVFLSGSKIDYAFYDNSILPFKLYESNGDEYEESLEVKSYDKYGNPKEIVDLKTGIHSVYLWDEYGRYMIAMINNAELSQVENLPLLLSASSWARYAMLQEKFPNAQIQTWDYEPLIGVSSYTNVNGQTVLYEYDGLGRLKSEKRMVKGETKSDTIHQYEYNYKN